MKKYFIVALLFALSFSCFDCLRPGRNIINHRAQTGSTPVEWNLARSVARLTYRSSEGLMISTAFSIASDYMVTAGHSCLGVMKDSLDTHKEPVVQLEYINQNDKIESLNALVLFVDTASDVCVLYNNANSMLPLPLVPSEETQRLSRVYLIGAPLGHFPTLVDCYLASHDAIEEIKPEASIQGDIVISCMGSPGNSGSPIVNEKGQVIGILTNAALIHPGIPLGQSLFATPTENLLIVLHFHNLY